MDYYRRWYSNEKADKLAKLHRNISTNTSSKPLLVRTTLNPPEICILRYKNDKLVI